MDKTVDFSTEIIEVELPGGTRGLQGETGPKGDTGATPEFHIGTVSDTENAEATITGTDTDPVLNLGLPRGKSGVWIGDSAPTEDGYTVWINPEDTPGTIPTKTSELQNDSGYITTNDIPKDVYSFQETLTNKVFVDSNGVEHPVYRKMMWVDFSAFDSQGHYEHGIENLGGVLTQKWLYENTTTTETYRSADPYYIGDYYARMLSVFSITDEYFEIYEYEPSNFSLLLLLEYTKTS